MSSVTPHIAWAMPPPVALSTVFCADDADVIIRAAGTCDFRVHKHTLSLASPIFKDMFTVPQPPTNTPGTLPHVDVDESAETWEHILQIVYPMANPVINDLNDLEFLLLAAKKYEMDFIIDTHKNTLQNRGFILEDPLHLYAIACACGFDDQAKYVARHAEHLAVTGRSNAGNLKGLTVESYHRLVSFLAKRDNQWHQILSRAPIPSNGRCGCDRPEILYEMIKVDLRAAHLQKEEIYLKALENLLHLPRPRCAKLMGCVFSPSEIRRFIEERAMEKEAVCSRCIW